MPRGASTKRLALVGRIGQQGDMPSALEGHREPPLVASTGAGHAAREDLSSLTHEAAESRHFFVIDQVDLLRAEVADLLVRLSVSLIGCWRHGLLCVAP